MMKVRRHNVKMRRMRNASGLVFLCEPAEFTRQFAAYDTNLKVSASCVARETRRQKWNEHSSHHLQVNGLARATAIAGGAFTLLAVCAVSPGKAQQTTATGEQGVLDPVAAQALKQLSSTLAAAPALTVRMTALREGRLPNKQLILLGGTTTIAIARPNHMTAMVGSDLGNFGLWYDGDNVTVLNPDANVYATTPLQGNIDTAIRWIETRLGLDVLIRPLLVADPYPELVEPGTTGVYVITDLRAVFPPITTLFAAKGQIGKSGSRQGAAKITAMVVSLIDRGAPGISQPRAIVEFVTTGILSPTFSSKRQVSLLCRHEVPLRRPRCCCRRCRSDRWDG